MDNDASLLSHIEDILRENEKYTKMLLRERNVNKLISNIDLAGEVGDVRALYPVLDVLSLTNNKRVIATALNTLGKLGDMSIIPIIGEYLYDDNSRVRANAVEALGRIGHPKIVRLIVPFLKDSDNRVRANAAKCLWKFGREEIIHTLKEMMESGSPRMRASAIYALTELSDENVIGLVKQGLQDEDERVREVAKRCLKDLEKKFRTRDALMARYGSKTMDKLKPETPSPAAEQPKPAAEQPKPAAEQPKPAAEQPKPAPPIAAQPPVAEDKIELDLPLEKTTEAKDMSSEWGALMEMVSKAEARVRDREATAAQKKSFLVDEDDLGDLEFFEEETAVPETDADMAGLAAAIAGIEPAPEAPAPAEEPPPEPAPEAPAPAEEPAAEPAPEAPAPAEEPPPEPAPEAPAPAEEPAAPGDASSDGLPLEPKLLERLAEIDTLVQDAAEFMNRVAVEENTVRKVNVIEMAGKVGDPKALLPILDLLQVEKNERVISVGLKTVGQLGDEGVIPFLLEYVRHTSARIRSSALEGLDIVGHPNGIRGMISLLLDANVMVRAKAAKALWKFDKKDIFRVIEEITIDGSKDEKLAALHALEKLADERAIKLLDMFSEVDDLTIEREARSLLAKLHKEQKRKERFQKIADKTSDKTVVAGSTPAAAPSEKTQPAEKKPAEKKPAAVPKKAAPPPPPAPEPSVAPGPALQMYAAPRKKSPWLLLLGVGALVILFAGGIIMMGKMAYDMYTERGEQPSLDRETPTDASSGGEFVIETADSGAASRQADRVKTGIDQFIEGAAFAIGTVSKSGKTISIIGKNMLTDRPVNYSLEDLPSETVIIMPKTGGVLMVHGEKLELARRMIGKEVLLIRSKPDSNARRTTGRQTGRKPPSRPPVGGDTKSEITAFYRSLTRAWNDRDIDTIMDHYSKNFMMQGSDYDLLRESYLTEFEIAGEIQMHIENEKIEFQESGVRHTSTIYFDGMSADGFMATRDNTYSRRIDTLKQEGNDWKIVFSEDILE